MDEIQFDSLVRGVATAVSRRQMLIAVLVGIVPAVLQSVTTEARDSNRHNNKTRAGQKRLRRRHGRNRHERDARNDIQGEKKRKGCPEGFAKCTIKKGKRKKRFCVDAQNDPTNCGGCGQVCQAGQVCQGGLCACSGPACVNAGCSVATCSGCCDGATCQPGGTNQRCGRNGQPCATCGSGQTCDASGTCVTIDLACNTASCSGCCAGATCQAGNSDAQCGANGEACIACASDEQCEAGRCRSLSVCANPGTCGDRPECGPGTIPCSCGTSVEGEGFCTRGGSCSESEPCTSTSDCPIDHTCSQGCCAEPICIPACVLTCVPDPVATTCATTECGDRRNNCGLKVDCGGCDAGNICAQNVCVPEPDPEIVCPSCGECSQIDMNTDNIGFCSQGCRTAMMCPAASANADVDLLHRELRRRGFVVSGPAYSLEVDEIGDTPDASIFIVPFANSITNETAGLAYGELTTGGNPIPIVIIGDENESPLLALVVDNGEIQEIVPSTNRNAARSLRRQHLAASGGLPFTCRRCSAACRFSAGLGGIAVGIIFGVLAVGTGGVAAIGLGLAGAAFGLGGFLAGEFCPNWCGCVYCGCTDTCYNSAGECTAVCKATLGCFSRICDSAQPGDC